MNKIFLIYTVVVPVLLCCKPVMSGDWQRGRYGARPDFMGKVADMPRRLTHLNHTPLKQISAELLPESFTWCDTAGDSICTPSWNQHIPQYCGACWAHGTLSMIQDRLAIMKGKGLNVMLSRQTLLNCAPFYNMSAGCDGGDPIDVFRYMSEFGLPDESCLTYNATDHTKYLTPDAEVTECPARGKCLNCMPIPTPAPGFSQEVCWPVPSPLLYGLSAFGKVDGCGPLAMMNEIYQRGPITCSIAADSALTYDYRGGVYEGKNATDVDHDVEVVGWGVHEGQPFWHVRNSWGTFWGEMGFVKIQRGANHMMLEACDCWYANPTWDMEAAVVNGSLGGTMYGVVDMPSSANPTQAARARLMGSAASLRGETLQTGQV